MNYSRYNITIGTDPAEYGSYCTEAQAESCADMLAQLIAEEFEGIRVRVRENGHPVSGPDAETCEEIRLWIQETGFPIAVAEGGR